MCCRPRVALMLELVLQTEARTGLTVAERSIGRLQNSGCAEYMQETGCMLSYPPGAGKFQAAKRAPNSREVTCC